MEISVFECCKKFLLVSIKSVLLNIFQVQATNLKRNSLRVSGASYERKKEKEKL